MILRKQQKSLFELESQLSYDETILVMQVTYRPVSSGLPVPMSEPLETGRLSGCRIAALGTKVQFGDFGSGPMRTDIGGPSRISANKSTIDTQPLAPSSVHNSKYRRIERFQRLYFATINSLNARP
jgi:hypothetical protein